MLTIPSHSTMNFSYLTIMGKKDKLVSEGIINFSHGKLAFI